MAIEFDKFPEAGRLIGFGQNTLEADSESRDEKSLDRAIVDERRRFHLFKAGKVLVRKGGNPTATFGAGEAERFAPELSEAVLLGADGNGPRLAAPFNLNEEAFEEGFHLYDMRALLYSSSVSDQEASAASRASSLLHWHAMNAYCGRCGAKSRSRIGGYRRDCGNCDATIFPRTDPVVIMLAIRENRCLLGRGPHFPPLWYSALAGFVEPGETIEAAVRRETLEESGIGLRRVLYHASQPWPFPHSLMIGAYGEAVTEDIRFDPRELEDCRWFPRSDVRAMIAGEHPDGFKCPPTKAIAHSLIGRWLDD